MHVLTKGVRSVTFARSGEEKKGRGIIAFNLHGVRVKSKRERANSTVNQLIFVRLCIYTWCERVWRRVRECIEGVRCNSRCDSRGTSGRPSKRKWRINP